MGGVIATVVLSRGGICWGVVGRKVGTESRGTDEKSRYHKGLRQQGKYASNRGRRKT